MCFVVVVAKEHMGGGGGEMDICNSSFLKPFFVEEGGSKKNKIFVFEKILNWHTLVYA